MAKKSLQKALALGLTVVLCMGLFSMQAMAVNDEEIIEEEILFDENGLPLVDIQDEPIPITELPAGISGEEDTGIEDLTDAEIPLAAVPQTGDASVVWLALSGIGLSGLLLTGKRYEEEK